jgi:hypothetical protein
MVGLEIEALWAALPAATRRGLGDLPTTAEALRRRIEELRRLLGELDDPALPPSAEALRLREHLLERRTTALQALERLRLLVLRLAGEVQLPGDLTEQLRGARALESELLIELGAHPDVAQLLRTPERVTG